MKRPWSGQVEKAQDEDRPEFDPQVKIKLRTEIFSTSSGSEWKSPAPLALWYGIRSSKLSSLGALVRNRPGEILRGKHVCVRVAVLL